MQRRNSRPLNPEDQEELLQQPASTSPAMTNGNVQNGTSRALWSKDPGDSSSVGLAYHRGSITLEDGFTVLKETGALATAPYGFVNEEVSRRVGALVLGFDAWEMSSMMDMALGQVSCHRLLAMARCKLWWMTPAWGSSAEDVPPEAQFLLLETRPGGPYVLMLPLIDGAFRATLRPPAKKKASTLGWIPVGASASAKGEADVGPLGIRIESGDSSNKAQRWEAALLVAASWDPYSLVEKAVASAAALSGGGQPLSAKMVPETVDLFGWCTWDAFYSRVAAQGLQDGVKSLQEGGAPPRVVILDDGWQQTQLDASLRPPHAMLDEQRILRSERSVLHHEAEELASHAAGSAASIATMPLIEPSDIYDDEQVRSCLPASRVFRVFQGLLSALMGYIMGILEFLFIKFYENIVDKSSWDSTVVKCFRWCATQGPLKRPLLHFFATSGDFVRRLVHVKANHKFASPSTTSHGQEHMEESLGDVVSYMKSTYGVKYLYCWHGLSAYWGGVSLEASTVSEFAAELIYANPTPGVLEIEPSMGWGPASLAGVGVVQDAGKLYEAMHSYLSSAGVDGVKVDCQAGVGLVPRPGGGPTSALTAHRALERSVAKHFPGNHIINCMGHSTENFYRYTSSAIARVCDDFYPRDPASHTAHIGNAAYNSLYLSALVHPDWDMFQSKHPAAQLHAISRAVSGAAVYVSDKPGEHDFKILRRLVLPDGSVLRPLLPGKPTLDTIFHDPMCDGSTLLKVWNRNAVGGVVGVFNIQGASWDRQLRSFHIHDKRPASLWSRVYPQDIWGLVPKDSDPQQEFVVWRSVTEQLQVVSGRAAHILVKLEPGGSEAVTVMPAIKAGEATVAPIGLKELYNPGAAITSAAVEGQNGSVALHVGMRGCGTFLCYCTRRPAECRLGGAVVADISYDASIYQLELMLPASLQGIAASQELVIRF